MKRYLLITMMTLITIAPALADFGFSEIGVVDSYILTNNGFTVLSSCQSNCGSFSLSASFSGGYLSTSFTSDGFSSDAYRQAVVVARNTFEGGPDFNGDYISVSPDFYSISIAQGPDNDLVEGALLSPSSPISGVPETSTWTMMIIGFVGFAFAVRRKAFMPRAHLVT